MEDIVPATEVALITNNGMRGLEVLIPNLSGDEPIPDLAIFLLACSLRAQTEPGFVQDMLKWFDNQ